MPKTIKELQKRENEIWKHLEDVCEDETQKEIGELIEINIELEKRCNQ